MLPTYQGTLLLFLAASVAQADTPPVKVEDPQNLVTGVHTLPIKGALSGEVLDALVHEGDVYVVGKRWSKEEGGESLWLWRVGSDGQPVWHTGLSEPQSNGFPEARLMKIDPESGRLLVLCRQRSETYWASVDTEDGSHEREALPSGVEGYVTALSDGGFFANKKQRRENAPDLAKFTRFDAEGEVVWSRDFSPQIELPPAANDYMHSISSRAVLPLQDGGFVVVGMAGNYSNFGLAKDGESWVWLLRLSSAGEVLASHAIEDAYLGRYTDGGPVVERGDSLWLSYYRLDLPNEQEKAKQGEGKPTFRSPFQRCVARLDSELKPKSEHPLTERRVPDSVTLTSEPLFIFPLEGGQLFFAIGSDSEGDLQWGVSAESASPGSITPCRAVSGETTRCLVATLRDLDNKPGGAPLRVLLIFMKPGE